MEKISKNIKKTLKYVLIFTLFSFFFFLFGKPAYRKWKKDDVVITKMVDPDEMFQTPGITICPYEVRKPKTSKSSFKSILKVFFTHFYLASRNFSLGFYFLIWQ